MAELSNPAARTETQRTRRELTIAAAVMIVFSIVVAVMAAQIAARSGLSPSGPATLPIIVSAGLLIFSVLFGLETWLKPNPHHEQHVQDERASTRLRTVVIVLAVLVGYALLVGVVGYAVTTGVMFAIVSRIIGSRRWVLNIVVGFGLAFSAYFAFTLLLGVRLPAGVLGLVF